MDDWRQYAEDGWRSLKSLPEWMHALILAVLMFMGWVVWFVAT